MSRLILALRALALCALLAGCATYEPYYYAADSDYGDYYYAQEPRYGYYDDYGYSGWSPYYSVLWPAYANYYVPYYNYGFFYGITYFPQYWYGYGYGLSHHDHWPYYHAYAPYRYSNHDNYYDWYGGTDWRHRNRGGSNNHFGSAANEAERLANMNRTGSYPSGAGAQGRRFDDRGYRGDAVRQGGYGEDRVLGTGTRGYGAPGDDRGGARPYSRERDVVGDGHSDRSDANVGAGAARVQYDADSRYRPNAGWRSDPRGRDTDAGAPIGQRQTGWVGSASGAGQPYTGRNRDGDANNAAQPQFQRYSDGSVRQDWRNNSRSRDLDGARYSDQGQARYREMPQAYGTPTRNAEPNARANYGNYGRGNDAGFRAQAPAPSYSPPARSNDAPSRSYDAPSRSESHSDSGRSNNDSGNSRGSFDRGRDNPN